MVSTPDNPIFDKNGLCPGCGGARHAHHECPHRSHPHYNRNPRKRWAESKHAREYPGKNYLPVGGDHGRPHGADKPKPSDEKGGPKPRTHYQGGGGGGYGKSGPSSGNKGTPVSDVYEGEFVLNDLDPVNGFCFVTHHNDFTGFTKPIEVVPNNPQTTPFTVQCLYDTGALQGSYGSPKLRTALRRAGYVGHSCSGSMVCSCFNECKPCLERFSVLLTIKKDNKSITFPLEISIIDIAVDLIIGRPAIIKNKLDRIIDLDTETIRPKDT